MLELGKYVGQTFVPINPFEPSRDTNKESDALSPFTPPPPPFPPLYSLLSSAHVWCVAKRAHASAAR